MRALSRPQRRAFTACFLGWSLDSFDFFILTFCLDEVATQFHLSHTTVTESIFATLAMRPVGALLFGWLAEKFGRRPVLMANIVCFSVFELASAFSPSWPLFLASRALFGIAMGGEWGVGAALALESLPAEGRGFFSGLLQEGYVAGNLIAAAVYGMFGWSIVHMGLHGFFAGWRMLFVVGSLPALLVFYVNARVEESPAWKSSPRGQRAIIAAALLAIFIIPLWAWSHTVLLVALGGFLMQFMVQGAFGVIPAHLNELSPGPVRSVLPGLAYQLGAFFSSWNIVLKAGIAARFFGGRLAPVLAVTVLVIGLAVAGVTALGSEARGADLSTA